MAKRIKLSEGEPLKLSEGEPLTLKEMAWNAYRMHLRREAMLGILAPLIALGLKQRVVDEALTAIMAKNLQPVRIAGACELAQYDCITFEYSIPDIDGSDLVLTESVSVQRLMMMVDSVLQWKCAETMAKISQLFEEDSEFALLCTLRLNSPC